MIVLSRLRPQVRLPHTPGARLRTHRSWLPGGTVAVAIAVCALATAPAHATPTWLGTHTISAAGQDGAMPQIAVAADGATTAVWYGQEGGTFQIHAATRPGGGTWSAPQMLSVPGQSAYNPQVAVTADGTATALWMRNDGPLSRIQVSTRPRGGTWSAAQDLSAAGQAASGPDIVAADDGTTTVVWSRSDGSNRRVQAAVRPSGGAWSAAENLSNAGQDATSPRLVAAADGTTVVWNRSDGGAHRVQSVTRPDGGAWSAVQELSAAGQTNTSPLVAVADDGTVTTLWSWRDGSGVRVQSATSPDGATWSAPQDLSAPSVYLTGMTLEVAGDGTTAAAWTLVESSSPRVQAAVRPVGSPWGGAENLSAPGSDTPYPQIVIGADGATTAIWDRSENGAWVETATRPRGGTWTAPEQLSADGVNASGAWLAGGVDGTVAAMWSEADNGFNRMYARSRPSGGNWSAPQRISRADRSAGDSRLVAGGDGSFTAAWSESDGSQFRLINAATLDAAGPVLDDLVVPTTGTVGLPISVSVDPHDVWSTVGDTDWSFGDGSTATGTGATHVYAEPGEYAITVTSRDEHGNATSETRSITIDPALSPLPGPTPVTDPSPLPGRLPSCEARFVSVIGIEARGTRRAPTVRLTAVAARNLAGQTATVLRNDRPIATTTIPADGNVSAVVAAPRRAASRVRARYRITTTANGITTASGSHRPSRRAAITRRTTLAGGRIRVQGRISGIRRPTRLAVTGLALCGTSTNTATTIRTDKRGRFTATLTPSGEATATIYRVRYGGTTITLPTVAVRT